MFARTFVGGAADDEGHVDELAGFELGAGRRRVPVVVEDGAASRAGGGGGVEDVAQLLGGKLTRAVQQVV